MTVMIDPAVRAALTTALGHPPPFSADECAAYRGHLTLMHARDLSAIAPCSQLTGLEIYASTLSDLGALVNMKKLVRLRIVCTDVVDITAVADCSALETFDLVYTPVADAMPIFALPNLRTAQLVGNPLTSESHKALLLLQQTQAIRIGLSNEADWQVTRALYKRGVAGSFGIWKDTSLFVRPGIPRISNADCDVTRMPRAYLQSLMQAPDFTADSLFTMMGLGGRNDQSPPHRFDFQGHISIGYSEDARAWIIGSALSQAEQQALTRFTDRFSGALYYAENMAFLDAVESRHGVRLPAWFRETRQTLAFLLPYHFVQFQLHDLPKWSAPSENADALWYELRLRGVDNEEQHGIIETNHLFPIGAWLPEADLVFAIRLDDECDHAVYSYRVSNITTQGSVPAESIMTVSPKYSEFLTFISTLRLDTGEIIHANS